MNHKLQNKKITLILIRIQIITLLIFAAAAWLIIPAQFKKSAEKDAVSLAISQAAQIKQLRTYYSENIVRKVVESNSGMKVSHEHMNIKNIIPIPATFIHDIGDLLKDKSFDLSFYSPYPFSNRPKRKLEKFEKAAWSSLSNQISETFILSEEHNGITTIRIAVPDRMSKQLCVNCHNTHPLSTKTDWKLGDLRGILEISKDISDLVEDGRNTGRYLALSLIIIFGSITFLSYKKVLTQISLWSDRLTRSESDLNQAQSIAQIGSWSLDPKTNILLWSDEIYRIFGTIKKDTNLTYDDFLKHIHPDDKDYVLKQYERSMSSNIQYDIEHRIIKENDKAVNWVHEKCTHERNINGEIIRSTGTVQDITSRKQAEEEIQRLAMTDQLTGLANRNRFHQRFNDNLTLAHRENKLLALLLIDLDEFKSVNDNFGHIAGDELLKHVAEIFTSSSRKTDLVARLGGDEFAIILVHPEDKKSIETCAKRIIEKASSPLTINKHNVKIGASIGIALYPADIESDNNINEEDILIHKADVALYHAKKSGKNQLCFYIPELENK